MSSPSVVLRRVPVTTGRPGMLPPLLVALMCVAYTVGSAAGWGSSLLAAIMGDFGLSAASLCAGASCLWYARRVPGGSRPAWLLFALSSFMVATGNAVWGWYEVVLRVPVPSVSLADCFFLLFAPPAIIGLLVLAHRPRTRLGWVCLGLDSWLISGSLVTLTWSLALAHTTDSGAGHSLRSAVTMAYPMMDIVMVSMVLALRFRRSSVNRAAVNTALAALAVTVLSDALFTTPVLRDSYRSGELLDAGWFGGSMMMAYAPWVSAREDAVRAKRRVRPVVVTQPVRRVAGALTALTPYVAAAVCTLGIIYSTLHGRRVDRVVLLTCCLVVLALVIRQGIMLLDNIALTQELAQKENHFRSLVQGSSDVIMIASPSGVLRYVSPASQGVYGRAPHELIGTEFARLVHPADLGRLLREVRRFLSAPPASEPATRIECRIRSGSGSWLHVESTVNRHQDGLIFNCRDVTERVRLQAQLQHSASHDPLTDLPNRALFTQRVQQALTGRRTGDGVAAVLFIDLDGFKAVNDSVGHQAGDELLILAAQRLQEAVRAADTVARFGGDEFAALVCGGSDDRYLREFQIREVADRIRLSLSEPYRVAGTVVRVAASIGVAFAEPGTGCTELMRNADLAMYRAKAAGKGRVEMYVPQMQDDVVRRTELAGRLRAALHEGQFTLLHQPVVNLVTGRVAAVEAQARWRSAQGLLFTPAEFLRMAEDTDRTAELSRWLVNEAVEQAVARHRAGHRTPVAVRLPAKRLLDRGLSDDAIEAVARKAGLPCDALVLEVSESDPRDSTEELQRRLEALKRLGVRIALDCFGAGSGSMTALRRLPVDIVKIDRSFVEGVVESPRLYKLTAGMLRIATELGLATIADGVDLPEQAQALRAMGCTYAQGAVFAGPLDAGQLGHALSTGAYPVPHTAPPAVVPAGAVPAHHVAGSHDETSVPPA